MRNWTKKVGYFLFAAFLAVSAIPHTTFAADTFTNLSELTPALQATDESLENQVWWGTTASGNGKTYSVWTEGDSVDFVWKAYLYDVSANTVIVLSDLLPGSVGAEFAGAIAVKVFSTGDPLVAWCEQTATDEECFIYDGRTDTIIRPASLVPAQPTGGAWLDAMAIDEDDNYYLVYEHRGTRGLDDVFLYKSSTNTTANLSEKLAGGLGTGSGSAYDDEYLKINSDNEAYLVFHESVGSTTMTYLYNVQGDTITNLTSVAGGVGASGIGGSEAAAMQFLPNGDPLILFVEDPSGAPANGEVFLYNGQLGTATNLDNLYSGTANYTYSYMYFPALASNFSLQIVNGVTYATWSAVASATSRSDTMFYSSASGVTNISEEIAVGDRAWDSQQLLGFDGNNPVVYFTEGPNFTSAQLYKYDVGTDTTTQLDSFYQLVYFELLKRSSGEPYIVEQAYATSGSNQHIKLIDPATAEVTNLTTLAGITPINNSGRPDATIVDDAPLVAWAQGGAEDDQYVYDGRDDTVTNLSSTYLKPGYGNDDALGSYVHSDAEGNIYIMWLEYYGSRGEADEYFVVLENASTTPAPPTPTPPPAPSDDDEDASSSTPPPTSTSTPRITRATTTTTTEVEAEPDTPAPSGIDFTINLRDGQIITKDTYEVAVSFPPSNIDSISSADFYIDDNLMETDTSLDSRNRFTWLWDTVRDPGTNIKVVVHFVNGTSTTRSIALSSATTTAPSPAEQKSPWSSVYTIPLLFILITLVIFIIAYLKRRARNRKNKQTPQSPYATR